MLDTVRVLEFSFKGAPLYCDGKNLKLTWSQEIQDKKNIYIRALLIKRWNMDIYKYRKYSNSLCNTETAGDCEYHTIY